MFHREHILFLIKLASVARQQSLGRSGLMSLSECIFSASESSKISAAEEHGVVTGGTQQCIDGLSDINGTRSPRTQHCAVKADLIDSLRFIIENSKPHFNPNYRLRGIQLLMTDLLIYIAMMHINPLFCYCL